MSASVGLILFLSWLQVSYAAGTYLATTLFGFRTPVVSIGFGPPLTELIIGNTRFRLCVCPFFVGSIQIAGMTSSEDVDPHDRGSFVNGPLFARCLVMLAGPLCGIVSGFGLFLMAASAGYEVSEGPPLVVDVRPPANAVLELDDRILRINGIVVEDMATVAEQLSLNRDDYVRLTVERDGRTHDVRLASNASSGDNVCFGVTFGRASVQRRVALGEVLPDAGTRVRLLALELPSSLVALTTTLTTSESTELKAARSSSILVVAGVMAILYGIFNLLPIPGLNGGRIMFLLIEAVTKRRPNADMAHGIGLLLVGFVTIAVILTRSCFKDDPKSELISCEEANQRLQESIEHFQRSARVIRSWGLREPRLPI